MSTFPLFAAIIASMLHVISGPDHLAAVTPLAIESKRKSWKVGLLWGLGHIIGMLLIGVLLLVFKEYIPVKAISAQSELLVGIVLIGIGLWSFYRIFNERKKHKHPHIHQAAEPFVHIHTHKHNAAKGHSHSHKKIVKQSLISSFGIGILHGFAGIAHFLLLLPVLSFDNQEAIQYIIGFGIGTVLAMTTYALVLGKVATFAKQENPELLFKGIRLAGGLFAFIIGVYWLSNSI